MSIFSRIRPFPIRILLIAFVTLQVSPGLHASSPQESKDIQDITELDLEALLDVEVTSVSRKTESLSNAPAAVYVITNEDLRRSGVTNIPDALRMVPGVFVARIDSNKWAVSSRGFNGLLANKLLVMIDGRSIYTSTFSGVYWDEQDTLLEDIERIEVIRGPGATLWGANAVNGVINIITKHAAETDGWYFKGLVGNYEKKSGSIRYGSAVGDYSYLRGYGKYFQRNHFEGLGNQEAEDEWQGGRAGIRFDSQLTAKDSLMVSADISGNDVNRRVISPSLQPPFRVESSDNARTKGRNVNLKWRHTYSPLSEISIQSYLSRTERDSPSLSDIDTTFDLDFQHIYSGLGSQEIIWGLGYRNTAKKLNESTYLLSVVDTDEDLISGFFQDQFTLVKERLWLTLGAKIEKHGDTGSEILPSSRLLWTPSSEHKLWGAVSRTARTPSVLERKADIFTSVIPPETNKNPHPVPVKMAIKGNGNFESERATSYELGYRYIPADNLYLDFTAYQTDYEKLRNIQWGDAQLKGSYLEVSGSPVNQGTATTRGFEAAIFWRPTSWWSWDLSYSRYQQKQSDNLEGYLIGPNPDNLISLHTMLDLGSSTDLDLWVRYTGETETIDALTNSRGVIDDYVTLDARLAWRMNDRLELSLVGQNLLEDSHLEYIPEQFTYPARVPRSIYGAITLQFK